MNPWSPLFIVVDFIRSVGTLRTGLLKILTGKQRTIRYEIRLLLSLKIVGLKKFLSEQPNSALYKMHLFSGFKYEFITVHNLQQF